MGEERDSEISERGRDSGREGGKRERREREIQDGF